MKPTRYFHVAQEIERAKARILIEVGTWNGDRAIEMMEAALRAVTSAAVVYHGFDLFEKITPEKSKEEMNVKAPNAFGEVSLKLGRWAQGKAVAWKLHQGDTRETLVAFLHWAGAGLADFAWIDGGHSVETIARDWDVCRRLVRPGGIVLFDDYYSGMEPGFTERFGSNGVVDRLMGDVRTKTVLFPEKDPVKGGGWVQIAKTEVLA